MKRKIPESNKGSICDGGEEGEEGDGGVVSVLIFVFPSVSVFA